MFISHFNKISKDLIDRNPKYDIRNYRYALILVRFCRL